MTHSLLSKTTLVCPWRGGNALAVARVHEAPSLDDQTSPCTPFAVWPAMTHSLPANASTEWANLGANGAAGVACIHVAPSADDQTSLLEGRPPTTHNLALKTAMPCCSRGEKPARLVTSSHDRPSRELHTSNLKPV